MKKSIIFALFLLISVFLFLSSCAKHDEADKTKSEPSSDTTAIETEASTLATEPASNSIGGCEDGYFGVRAYRERQLYYTVTYRFVELIGGIDVFNEWNDKQPDTYAEQNEMSIVTLIKDFDISREDFDKANQQTIDDIIGFGHTPIFPPYEYEEIYDYNKELYEIYNADIIYTFDNEIINDYYARPPRLIIEDGTNALGEAVE